MGCSPAHDEVAITTSQSILQKSFTITAEAENPEGGAGTLIVDGKEVDKKRMEHTTPIMFPEDVDSDIGQDTRTGVALLEYRYDVPFKFTGKINKLTFDLGLAQYMEADREQLREIAERVASGKD